jgi:phenylacetate-CoA ligase
MVQRGRWGAERIADFQDSHLREIIRHAYARVPFYRQWLDHAGVDPDRVRTVEDLRRIPVVAKMDVRKGRLEDLVVQGTEVSRCEVVFTSGSTGIPLRIVLSPRELGRRKAPWVKFCFEMGMRPWHRRAGFDYISTPQSLRWYNRCGVMPWRPFRTELERNRAVGCVRRYRPRILSGVPALLHLFALQVREAKAHDIHPRFIHCGGEVLTPDDRRRLEETLGAPVLDTYGATEFGFIAAPCPAGQGYHLASDHLILECLRGDAPAAPGEMGEVVITGLLGRVMPFIRYGLGDLAVLGEGECACGNPRARIARLEGRAYDLIPLADGGVAAPFEPARPLFLMHDVLQFRVIQEEVDCFRVQLVVERPLPEEQLHGVRQFYETRLLAREVHFEFLSQLPPDESGKIRKVIPLVR